MMMIQPTVSTFHIRGKKQSMVIEKKWVMHRCLVLISLLLHEKSPQCPHFFISIMYIKSINNDIDKAGYEC